MTKACVIIAMELAGLVLMPPGPWYVRATAGVLLIGAGMLSVERITINYPGPPDAS